MAFLHNQHVHVPVGKAVRQSRSSFHRDAYRYILRYCGWSYFNPLKVLMPLALWLLAIGGVKVIYDVVTNPVG